MDDQTRREQAEALLKILELGQEEIRRGKYSTLEEVFAELDAMDEAEFKNGGDQ